MNAAARPLGSTSPQGFVEVDTLIVGAGIAGLGLGIRLARRGTASFLILERADQVGGTWRDNVYPGVACDIPSHLYSYSFRPKPDWSRFFAPGAEIQGYLVEAARDEGLLPHLRFGTAVLGSEWDEDDGRWMVRTTRGDYRCRVLVMAAGRLSEPRIPDVAGLDQSTGRVFHSSRWGDADLSGARVGIVGTGASAVQLIPEVAARAESVVVFQRSAPYVVPRQDREYTAAEQRLFARAPESAERLRSRLFWSMEQGYAQRIGISGPLDALRHRALAHLGEQVGDRGLRAALTPDYEIGCKRVLLSDDFYPALSRPTVVLEASALESVRGGTAVAASGRMHELDVLILATGFESTEPPYARTILGRNGVPLADRWADGMVAYASTAVHGFPNLFILDGPNASLGHNSAIYMIEAQIDHILDALSALADLTGGAMAGGGGVLEVTRAAEDDYIAELDAVAGSTVWLRGKCSSWYVDERSGRLTLLWPDFAFAFRRRLSRFDGAAYGIGESVGDGDADAAREQRGEQIELA
ncbi:flavin-containing monooxygenase [Naasia lichenicola]|uniref:NAD(P)/FAD-dependent oxidoreductase n=1 Tax=Naasia lichenicola TaxID=2565933 RepID=A0A4S4FT52_9MICO|nr:NAD(P)/FAD-dependent oxidoreductase [Naasia lichenicola]THG33508.1 NAD(P)/FAD-dependent oxidoreductase [Naasia lichenicola]